MNYRITSCDAHDYLNGRTVDALPAPPDRYCPGGIKWGSNPNRGRALQRARTLKQRQANAAALRALLPCIEFDTPSDALEVAAALEDFAIARANGWTLWRKGDAQSWVHRNETSKLAQARAMGAIEVPVQLSKTENKR